MSYNRARLLLGQGGVGMWVLLCAYLLQNPLPAPQLLLLYLGLSIPLDLLGGWILPSRFGQPTPILSTWLSGYLRAAFVHGSLLALAGGLLLCAGSVGLEKVAVVLLALALVEFQAELAALAGTLKVTSETHFEGRRVLEVACDQDGFTGGVSGLPGRERIVVPSNWSPELHRVALVRRKSAIALQARNLGLVVALVWNLAGFCLAARHGLSSSMDLAQAALFGTLWSFLGLLLLPRVARQAVYWADGQTLKKLGWPALSTYLDALPDETQAAHPWSEPVFYPIPSREERLRRLQSRDPIRLGAWHAARTALFLSVAQLGLLSRAVHCNSGRPALWFFPPAD